MTAIKRWLGIMGLASIIAFGAPLILRNSVPPTVRYLIEGIAFIAGVQLFFSWGWGRLLTAAVIFVVAAVVNSLSVMRTSGAVVASWVGIAAVAIAISFFDRRRTGSRADAR